MQEQIKRRRSKWDAPEKPKITFFGEVQRFGKELKEGLQEHWPAALGVVAGFVLFLCFLWLLTREYTGDVTGTVTFNGRPIPYGRVTFVGQSGRKKSASGMIKNGVYTVKNCPTGPFKVSVESMRAIKIEQPKSGPMEKLTKGFKIPANPDPPPPEVVGQFLPIPPEYGNADTSGLTYKVGWGSQTHNIDLTPR
jgi:hypothetical protein